MKAVYLLPVLSLAIVAFGWGNSSSTGNAYAADRQAPAEKKEVKMKCFDIPMDTAVFSSTYIFKDGLPVLYVVHDSEGDWQFHAGNGDFDTSKLMLVSLKNVLDYDPALNEVSDLPVDFMATRKSVDDPWVYSKS